MDLLDSPIMANEAGKTNFINELNKVNQVEDGRFFDKEKEVKPKINFGMIDSFMLIFGYERIKEDYTDGFYL